LDNDAMTQWFSEQQCMLTEEDLDAASLHRVASGVAGVYTHRAPGKETANEDAAVTLALDGDQGLIAIADGAGGFRAGEVASRLAIEALSEAARAAFAAGLPLRDAILTGIENANQNVLNLGIGAATTLVAVEIQARTIRTYHVGDSMALVVGQRGKIKLQTVSHSPVGYAVEAGVLDAAEALQHEERHLVSNFIGTADMRVEIGSTLELARRDTVVIASDGLFDNLHIPEIAELVRCGPIPVVMGNLVGTARQRMLAPDASMPSKPDDLTAIVYRLA